jgi:hypothetical protein
MELYESCTNVKVVRMNTTGKDLSHSSINPVLYSFCLICFDYGNFVLLLDGGIFYIDLFLCCDFFFVRRENE